MLRHELAILRRRSRRPALTWTDRRCLAAASRFLSRTRGQAFIVTPATKQDEIHVEHRDRLGGVVHKYVRAA